MLGVKSFSFADMVLTDKLKDLKNQTAHASLPDLVHCFVAEADVLAVHCGRTRLSRFGPIEIMAFVVLVPIVFALMAWLDGSRFGGGYYSEDFSTLEIVTNLVIITFAGIILIWTAIRKEITILTEDYLLVLSSVEPGKKAVRPRVAVQINLSSIDSHSTGFMGKQVYKLSANRTLKMGSDVVGQYWPERLETVSAAAFAEKIDNLIQSK